MKRMHEVAMRLLFSVILVVGLMPAFAAADDYGSATGDLAVQGADAENVDAEGEGEQNDGSSEAVDSPSLINESAAGQDVPDQPESQQETIPSEETTYDSSAEQEAEAYIIEEGVDGGEGEEPINSEQLEADDPEDETDLESQADTSQEAAYAILYTNGDLVFQHGDEADPAEGRVRKKWTGFEDSDSSVPWSDMPTYVKNVYFADTVSSVSLNGWFSGCSNLSSFDSTNLDTSWVTDMGGMFSGCSSLTSVDLSGLDTAWVTNMSGMFSGCSSLESVSLSGLDTSSVTDMSFMFSGCSSLASIDLSGLDTSSVEAMLWMFADCSSLTSLDLSSLDVSSVETMRGAFSGCSSLTYVDLTALDTSSVRDMFAMFMNCSSLTSVYLAAIDTSSVTDMGFTFSGCSSLKHLSLAGFDTSSVTSMWGTFSKCSSLTSLDLAYFDVSSVTDTSMMFSECSSLASLDLTGLKGSLQTNDLDGTWRDSASGKRITASSESFTAGEWVKLAKRTITKKAGTGGKVELRSATLYPYAGDEVVFRTIPDAGKELSSFNVTYRDPATGKTVKLVTGKGIVRRAGTGAPGTISEYAFSMPDCNVTINATFKDNTRTYAITKSMTGTGKAGSNLMLVGSDGKVGSQTKDSVKPTMNPKAGQKVYFKSVPAKGAKLTKFNVTYSYVGLDGKKVNVKLVTGKGITSHGGGLYSFTMPCYPVTLTGEFTK